MLLPCYINSERLLTYVPAGCDYNKPLYTSAWLWNFICFSFKFHPSSNMHLTRGKHASQARFHFVTINSYLSLWHVSLSHYCKHLTFCFAVYYLAYCYKHCMSLDLTVIQPNAASSFSGLHDVSLTTTTVVVLLCLFPKAIQQMDSVITKYLQYKCESVYLSEQSF